MDKKNTTIGIALLLTAFAVMFFTSRSSPSANRPNVEKGAPTANTGTVTPSSSNSTPSSSPATSATFASVETQASDTTLSNDYIKVHFTESGGAVLKVEFVKRDRRDQLVYPGERWDNQNRRFVRTSEPYVFNQASSDPILAFVNHEGLDRRTRFQRVSQTQNEIVYRANTDSGLEITRRYILPPNTGEGTDPYQIRHETTFRNTSQKATPQMNAMLSLGTAAPRPGPDDHGLQLTTGFSSGGDQTFIERSKLEAGSGFFGIGAHGATSEIVNAGAFTWTTVKNQFFASILTGDQPAKELVSRRVNLNDDPRDENPLHFGITGAARFDIPAIAAGAEAKLTGNLYVGPKEYRRLANTKVFKADQDKVMGFGLFKFFSQILLTLMTWIHGWMEGLSPKWAWGWAIILTTLTLKTIFIPFTLAASKSAKRMAKIQPELQAIREKYKDNPQKQQQATMEIFKTKKINPVGGCFPILITIPFFMGFFTMLQSAAELRFSPFLWALDLSSTDTVAVLFGLIPIRILPLLMGATMVIQMHLTPSPSVDNMQVKMMKFMPYVFTFFCYNFSCALSLYSFVNGLFTIGQQLVINRMKDPVEPAPATSSGKPLKNVTPKKSLK